MDGIPLREDNSFFGLLNIEPGNEGTISERIGDCIFIICAGRSKFRILIPSDELYKKGTNTSLIIKHPVFTPRMSLAKVPVTLIVSYAFKRCIRPPNPPPPKEERINTNFLEFGWYTTNTPGPAGVSSLCIIQGTQ